ncbi:uncharacterized protein LOC111532641 [Piliocolobus tephrosceles]|uniref:uncharacterized protein LOC111532641 n=1 Tax=Piliocolobus tephrosceles TaxID=591936 RepID=UPI000C2A5B94|nr:uncharacterized protein LOC111532641 [Piliocolobus tephrosceles]
MKAPTKLQKITGFHLSSSWTAAQESWLPGGDDADTGGAAGSAEDRVDRHGTPNCPSRSGLEQSLYLSSRPSRVSGCAPALATVCIPVLEMRSKSHGSQAREWLFRETHPQRPRHDSKFPFYCPPRVKSAIPREQRPPETAIPLLKLGAARGSVGPGRWLERLCRSAQEPASDLGRSAVGLISVLSRHWGGSASFSRVRGPPEKGAGGLFLSTPFLGSRAFQAPILVGLSAPTRPAVPGASAAPPARGKRWQRLELASKEEQQEEDISAPLPPAFFAGTRPPFAASAPSGLTSPAPSLVPRPPRRRQPTPRASTPAAAF